MARLSNASVEAAPARADRYDIWDDKLAGFAVRIFPSGTRSYFVQYRNAQADTKRLTIGKHGAVWPVDKARKRAAELLRDAATGGDPAMAKQQDRKAGRVSELVDAYKLQRVPLMKASTRVSELWLLERSPNSVLALFGKRTVASLHGADIEKIKLDLRATPGAANKLMGIMSRLCTFAEGEGQGLRPQGSNPCRGIKRFAEKKIERWFTADERARLEFALATAEQAPDRSPGQVDPIACAVFRLLAMTGMRLGEALDLRWRDVELDHRRLVLPTTKTEKGAIVRLSPSSIALLEALPESHELVFPARDGQRLTNMQRRWIKIRKAAGVECRIHDLRHGWASDAAMAGVTLHVIGAQLRHKSPVSTHRYANLASDVVGEAVDLVGGIIEGNTRRGDARPKVVVLPKRKARAK